MAVPAYLTLQGAKQGNIQGGCDAAGHENTILVTKFDHEVTIGHDPLNGRPVAKRVHKPMTVTKTFDVSSPQLYQALTSGEKMTTVDVKWFRINSGTGLEEHYFTTHLEEAIIVSIKPWMSDVVNNNNASTHMEDVSFTYSKIVWTYEPTGVIATDSWSAK